MKKTILLTVGLMCLLIVQSCKKSGDDTTPTPQGETKYELVELTTTHGTMTIWLHEETIEHKKNFLKLAKEGYYDGTTFHRLVKQFVAQGGDPNSKDADKTNDGQGGPPYRIPAEIFGHLKHVRGAIGAARDNNPDKSSNGSQFYIVVADNANTQSLDGGYTVFGHVIKGIESTNSMMAVPYDQQGRPLTDMKMTMKVISKTEAELLAEYAFEVPE